MSATSPSSSSSSSSGSDLLNSFVQLLTAESSSASGFSEQTLNKIHGKVTHSSSTPPDKETGVGLHHRHKYIWMFLSVEWLPTLVDQHILPSHGMVRYAMVCSTL
jgi:hypothetical protein